MHCGIALLHSLFGTQLQIGYFGNPEFFLSLEIYSTTSIVKEKKSRRLELFAMLVWTVWHCRNHIRTTPLRTILSHKSSLWPLKL